MNQPFDSIPDSIAVPDPLLHPKPLIEQAWVRVVLYLCCFLLTVALTQTLAFGLLMVLTDMDQAELAEHIESSTNLSILALLELFTLGGLLLQTYLFRRYIDRKSLSSLGFRWQGMANDILLGLALGFALIFSGFLLLMLLGNLQVSGLHFYWESLLGSAFLCLIIALNEEILVRGYILNNLMQSMNKYAALVISAFLFSIMHIFNPNISFVSALNIFLAGILLGIYYIYRQNLWFPIALHFAWNYFQGPIFGFEVSGIDLNGLVQQKIYGNALLTGGDFGFEGSILLTAAILLAIFIIYKLKQYEPQP